MTNFIIVVGMITTVLLIGLFALILWVWFIWPAVEACSLTQMHRRIHRMNKAEGLGVTNTLRSWWSWYQDCVMGRNWTALRGPGWEWEGVGNWRVYDND